MEQTRIRVAFDASAPAQQGAFEIIIRNGLMDGLGSEVSELLSRSKSPSSVAIIADSNTAKLFGPSVKAQFSEAFPEKKITLFTFRAGERSKGLSTASELASRLSVAGGDRGSIIVALGGGVVGDLSGFVASIYKRGIRYFQVPTTLLAQVDSSIGGKTGVDTRWGKNQIGTFYEPLAVLIDPMSLDTLPRGEIINGSAEIVKSAIIASRDMFERLTKIDPFELSQLREFIPETCRIKAKVVSKDEREENLRAILNYGHTVGHAIESSSGFRLSHGRSVILGMIAEGWIGRELGLYSERDYSRQQELLLSLAGLILKSKPRSKATLVREILHKEKELVRLALADKKSSSGTIRMSLPSELGKMSQTSSGDYRIPVPIEMFLESLKYLRSALTLERI